MSKIINKIADNVFFDPERHEYFENLPTGRRVIPGVTEVLRRSGAVPDNRFFTEAHRVRGQAVHDACHDYESGVLVMDDLDEEITLYLQSYLSWRHEYTPEILKIEEGIYSAEFDVCGTFDIEAKMSGNKFSMLIDIKSGGKHESHIWQLAGYGIIYYGKDWLKHPIANLYLRKDGKKARFERYDVVSQMIAGKKWMEFVREYRNQSATLFGGER